MTTAWTEVYGEELSDTELVNKAREIVSNSDKAMNRLKGIGKKDRFNVAYWNASCECFNCGYKYEIRCSRNVPLAYIQDVYVNKYVCLKCKFINKNKFGKRKVDKDYKFHGVVTLEKDDGQTFKIVNNTVLGNQDPNISTAKPIASINERGSNPIDRNKDNIYISIWDSVKKKTMSRLDELLDEDSLEDE